MGKVTSNHKHNWSDKKKIEVVTTYLALGKAPMVEAVTGVPRQTIRIWKMQPWWNDLVKEIRQSEDQELDGKLSRIIDKSLDAVNERIEGGDFILDSKTGQVKRIPVKLRDVHRVTTDLLDKRSLIRGRPTSITERISTEDVLKNLAQQFQAFVNNKEKVIEGEIVDALYEERQEGLQDGERQVQLPSVDEETESSPEQGASGTGTEVGAQHNGGRGPQEAPFERREEYPLELESSEPPPESFIQAK